MNPTVRTNRIERAAETDLSPGVRATTPRLVVRCPTKPLKILSMDEDNLKHWVDAYGRAWQKGDPDAAVLLFAEDAAYQETPFAEPAQGRRAIHAYWQLVREHHEDVEFSYSILSVTPAIVRCRAAYVNRKTGVPTRFDGIFLLEFDSEHRCTSFREWWHADPGPSFQV
jgi:hypothetical protein